MQFDIDSTICGIASGQQAGIRGAIRISGPDSIAIVQRAQAVGESLFASHRSRRLCFDWKLDSPLSHIAVDLWLWPTHRSYTGMPSVEIHTLGQPIILQNMVEQLCRHGAKMAQPGEFTLRAFLAGRMDLTQCEAVLGVIEAKSTKTLDVALRQLGGGLSKPLAELRIDLIELLADIEAGLDFVDEDIEFISQQAIEERLAQSKQKIEALLDQIQQRRSSSAVARVALVGLPNAGKSSMFNAIVQRNVAIVNEKAGTTRDFVRVTTKLSSGSVEWIDTAGMEVVDMRATNASISSAAQQHRVEQTEQADLILYCVEQNREVDRIAFSQPSEVWLVRTKCDTPSLEIEDCPSGFFTRQLATSSQTGEGILPLVEHVDSWLRQRNDEFTAVAPLTATRCVSLLAAANESTMAASLAAKMKSGNEIVSGEIRLTLDHLGQIAGEVYTDDILDALFSRFCIGK